jgi:hypothetical protein
MKKQVKDIKFEKKFYSDWKREKKAQKKTKETGPALPSIMANLLGRYLQRITHAENWWTHLRVMKPPVKVVNCCTPTEEWRRPSPFTAEVLWWVDTFVFSHIQLNSHSAKDFGSPHSQTPVHRSYSVDGFIHRFFRIVARRSDIASQQLPMIIRLTVQHYSSLNFNLKKKKKTQSRSSLN